MIKQVSVFLENRKGQLSDICHVISEQGINMHALFLADTRDYGVVRIFCDTPHAAQHALSSAGYRALLTDVCAFHVKNEKGALAELLSTLDAQGIDVRYGYCYSSSESSSINVIKVDGERAVEQYLVDRGFTPAKAEEIYVVD